MSTKVKKQPEYKIFYVENALGLGHGCKGLIGPFPILSMVLGRVLGGVLGGVLEAEQEGSELCLLLNVGLNRG